MKRWFTSDNHFGHKRILEFCPRTRPFKSVDEMDEAMIIQWQSQVAPDDEVWCLGDFTWHWDNKINAILDRLPGRIHMIWGNHDHELQKRFQSRFVWSGSDKFLRIDGVEVHMYHFPIYEWDRYHRGSLHFHGHTHGNVVLPGRALDVGIDGALGNGDCRLYSWEECKAYCLERPITNFTK